MTKSRNVTARVAGLFVAPILFVACSGHDTPVGRGVTVGADIALELAFEDPVVLAIESQATDGRSWQPCGYLAMTRGTDRVTIRGTERSTDLRITLGIGGRIVDRADGKVVADGATAVVQSFDTRPVDVREARIGTQLQIARGTIATVRLDGATTATTTRPFRP